MSLPVVGVISSFGRFLKYSVSALELATHTVASPGTISQSSSSDCPISSLVHHVQERTMKDQLFNDILKFFTSMSVSICDSEASSGKRLVVVLRDIFWHIDGHHHVFEQRAQAIPHMFHVFTNYNMPERSKHRKRLTRNISSDLLRDFSLELSTILHFGFWDRPRWVELKSHFNMLLVSISSYVDYLVQKNKKMKTAHQSLIPVRNLAKNLQLKFIASCTTPQPVPIPVLELIQEHVRVLPFYEIAFITHLLSHDCVQKHRVVNCLVSTGLQFPSILLVYAPGSNIGNLHFLWRVPDDVDVGECFEQSQSTVEQAKLQIPVFHSRAMRSAMYQKFGRISSAVKPAVLRYFYKDLTGLHAYRKR